MFTEDWVGPMNYIRTLLKNKFLGKNRSLKKASVPTLFIVGNADPYCSLEMICKSSEYVENFTLKIVEGGGHFLPQEMPNYINSLILDFMKSEFLANSLSGDLSIYITQHIT
jgi:pimeloyl-ACP methyl ester carboxylesterase